MFITTCIEIMILQSFMMLSDERKCMIEIKSMTLIMENVFNENINVVVKVEFQKLGKCSDL